MVHVLRVPKEMSVRRLRLEKPTCIAGPGLVPHYVAMRNPVQVLFDHGCKASAHEEGSALTLFRATAQGVRPDTSCLLPINAALLAFCQRLPKVELHAHLNGSIRESTLHELAKQHGIDAAAVTLARKGALPPGCRGERSQLSRTVRQC